MATLTPSQFFKQFVVPEFENTSALASIHKTLWDLDNRKIYHLVNAIAALGGESTPTTKRAVLPSITFEEEEPDVLSRKDLTGKRLVVLAQKFLIDYTGTTKYSIAKQAITEFTMRDIGAIHGETFLYDPHLRYTILKLVEKLVDINTKITLPSGCNNYVIAEIDELV